MLQTPIAAPYLQLSPVHWSPPSTTCLKVPCVSSPRALPPHAQSCFTRRCLPSAVSARGAEQGLMARRLCGSQAAEESFCTRAATRWVVWGSCGAAHCAPSSETPRRPPGTSPRQLPQCCAASALGQHTSLRITQPPRQQEHPGSQVGRHGLAHTVFSLHAPHFMHLSSRALTMPKAGQQAGHSTLALVLKSSTVALPPAGLHTPFG